IPAVVHGDGGYGAGVSQAYAFGPTVWIQDAEDEQRALEIIRKHEPTPQHCHHCGYDLRGLPEPRCPECGQPFARRDQRPDWTCPRSGEVHEGQVTACWKCGAVRPEELGATGEA